MVSTVELQRFGLTDGESMVYNALLELGSATLTPLSRKTGLQSSSVYYCLQSLLQKGLVNSIQRRGRRHYHSADPSALLLFLDEKKEALEKQRTEADKMIPALRARMRKNEERTVAEVYEGFKGTQAIFNMVLDVLKDGDSYEAFVIEEELGMRNELSLLFQRHNRELHRRKIKLRLLAPSRIRKVYEGIYGKKFLSTYQQVRYTNESIPVGITIFKDNVVTHLNEQGRPMAFRVRNERLAQIYRSHFEDIWSRAKP